MRLVTFLNPGHLDGFQYSFSTVPGIVVKVIECHDPLAQIGKTDLFGIDIGMSLV